MPYICLTRTDVPPATLQILDLHPHTSQRNQSIDPPGQTKYVSFRPQNDNVITIQPGGAGNPVLTEQEFRGLAAYLIDRIEDTPNGDAFTTAQANTVAAALIAAMTAKQTLTAAAVNTIIQLTVAGSGIGLGNSTATLKDVLAILSGDEYVVPARSQVGVTQLVFDPTIRGSFKNRVRHTYESGALYISLGEGHLAGFASSEFSYLGVEGAAVAVYDDAGNLLG